MRYLIGCFLILLVVLTTCNKEPVKHSNIKDKYNIGECYNIKNVEMVIINKMDYGVQVRSRKSSIEYYYTYNEFDYYSVRMDCY